LLSPCSVPSPELALIGIVSRHHAGRPRTQHRQGQNGHVDRSPVARLRGSRSCLPAWLLQLSWHHSPWLWQHGASPRFKSTSRDENARTSSRSLQPRIGCDCETLDDKPIAQLIADAATRNLVRARDAGKVELKAFNDMVNSCGGDRDAEGERHDRARCWRLRAPYSLRASYCRRQA
jgi:hypothetical protein